jgi:hypothetical protein
MGQFTDTLEFSENIKLFSSQCLCYKPIEKKNIEKAEPNKALRKDQYNFKNFVELCSFL